MATAEEMAEQTYEMMRERYGHHAFRPWKDLGSITKAEWVEMVRLAQARDQSAA